MKHTRYSLRLDSPCSQPWDGMTRSHQAIPSSIRRDDLRRRPDDSETEVAADEGVLGVMDMFSRDYASRLKSLSEATLDHGPGS